MRLGPITILFLLLILIPGTILAYLGWQSTATLAEIGRRHAESESRDRAKRLPQELAAAVADLEQQIQNQLEGCARAFQADLGRDSMAASLHRATSLLPGTGALQLLASDGGVILPRPADSNPPAHLQEWPEFLARRRQAETLEFGEGQSRAAGVTMIALGHELATIELRARAYAHAILCFRRGHAQGEREAEESLLSLPPRIALAASPMVVEALRGSPVGQQALRAAMKGWGLLDTPAPADQRAAWNREFGATSRTQTEPAATARWPLGSEGAALAYRVPLPNLAAAVLTLKPASGWTLHADPTPHSLPATLRVLGAPVRVHLLNPAFAQLRTEARSRRILTSAGILVLLVAMVLGMFLVRRALLRERSARQLRDEFIANVSHELRTPLTSMRMHAAMLREPDLSATIRDDYSDVIETEGARLAAMVEDLLDFAALERGTRQLEETPVDLAAAALATAKTWAPLAADRGIALRVAAPQEVAGIADPTALSRILTNLVHNAFHHGRPTAKTTQPEVVLRVLARGESEVAIEVTDNGPGVPSTDRERIFDRFAQSDRGRGQGGAGIGLSLSRELARAMGGDLRLTTERDETCFRLTLPALPDLEDVA